MTPRNRVFALVTLPISVAILVAGAWLASAGNLNPPAGPVAGTMKTLADVEPRVAVNATNTPGDADSLFKISQPGSYYLSGNITGVVGKHGIEIAASGVTLDLKGYDLVAVPGIGDASGVKVTIGGLTNIAVVNGSVRNWGNNGVDLVLAAADCRVDSVLASGNTFYGINTGSASAVTNCSANANLGSGINTGIASTVTNCTANAGEFGITTDISCTVTNCTTLSNGNSGISAGPGSTVTNCSAIGNVYGIRTGSGCTVTNCTAHNNAGWGIYAASGCTVTSCSASNNNHGIQVEADSIVTGCNTTSNPVNGLDAGARCTVMNCSASLNGAAGVGAGIFVSGNTGRYDNNQTVNNFFDGMSFLNGTTGNVITRNYSAGNGGFQFRLEGGNVAGVSGPTRNECAPIFTPAAVNGVWLAGNTNPWANMTR